MNDRAAEGAAETPAEDPSAPRARVSINGEDHDIALPKSVESLLEDLSLDLRHVAVERNRELVPKRTFAETMLVDQDKLEIVTFVGGG